MKYQALFEGRWLKIGLSSSSAADMIGFFKNDISKIDLKIITI